MQYRKISAALFVFLSSPLFAECVPHICSDVFVERLYPNENGLVYVATSGSEAALNCNAVSGEYVSFNLADPAGEAFYSTLLAAQLANKKVSLRIADESEGCLVQYITINKQ